MTDALIPAHAGYSGNPVCPPMDRYTPPEVVAGLTSQQRQERVLYLITQAHDIVGQALASHLDGRELVAHCVLYSGGNDSTTLAHLFRDRASHAIHANTTIGIEATRQFVRDTCQSWGLPLIEKVAPISYRDLVIERGFPGPAMHFKMYSRLKERCLEAAKADLLANPYRQRVLFIAGRRREESARRTSIPTHERRKSAIWASPLANWTKLDLVTYRAMHPDVPENPVSAQLHMSGECLCGAFAHPGELDEIAYWFPGVADEIRSLEAEVLAAGHPEPFCRWGHGQGGEPSESGPLCSSCDARGNPALQMLFTDTTGAAQ